MGLYSILVADDEDIIREGIKHLLPYEQLGYSICGEAATGDAALEKMLSLRPDVVLLDIRMPGISGLDAIRLAREQGFAGKVVIISSYTDFRYAQEAIRQNVQYYLVKPIDDDELKTTLLNLRRQFDAESSRQNVSDLYRQKARAGIITDLLTGASLPTAEQLAQLGLTADCYQAVILQRPANEGTESLPAGSAAHREYDHILLDGQEVLLVQGSAAVRRLQDMAQFNAITAHGNTDAQAFFACGDIVTDPAQIPRSYQQARTLLSRRFFCDQNQYLLDTSHLPASAPSVPKLDNALVQKYAATILDGITAFNRRIIAQTLKELEDLLYNAPEDIPSIRLFLTDLYLQVKMQISHLYTGTEIPFLSNAEIIRTVADAPYLYEIIRFFSQRFEVYMAATGISTRDSVLGDILHYIHCNYASNITLENIAPLFGYNRSYLGKIFTKKMGQNFNSYVDQVRIERSKEMLLQEDTKVYIIAERIGYKNVDYFHIKFRKYVGLSPSEYRKKYKGSSCSPDAENRGKGTLAP